MALNKKKFKEEFGFVSGKSSKAVTTKICKKNFKEVTVVDTPGFNDPKKERSDIQLMLDVVHNSLNDVLYEIGIASLCQMVMIPESGRVSKSAILVTLRMIQTFTLSYPDCKRHEAPKLFIVFTNFSKFEKDSDGSESEYSLSEAEEDDVAK